MKNVFTKKSKIVIISLLFALLIVCSISLCFVPKTAQAESPINTNKYLQKTDLECLSLNSPKSVYSDEQITAIVDNDKLLVEYNGAIFEPFTDFTAINQVLRLDSYSLLINDFAKIYSLTLDLENKTLQKNDLQINGNDFALNSNLLVTTFNDVVAFYDRNENVFIQSTVHQSIFDVKKDTPITANDNYILFLNQDDVLCKYDINTKDITALITSNESLFKQDIPHEIIANNDYVFVLLTSGKIVRADFEGNFATLTYNTQPHSDYDLGKVSNPINFAFKGDNLLIIDGNTIQEFKIEDDKLNFTGYAIASGKTAYNRINNQTKNAILQKCDDNVAVLDDDKLSIIDTNSTDRYSIDTYKNYVKGTDKAIGETLPNKFALGKSHAFLIYNAGTPSCQLKVLNFETDQIYDVKTSNLTLQIEDVVYQGNSFYLLNDIGNFNPEVYKIDEQSLLLNEQENSLFITENHKIYITTSSSFKHICIDLFGNIYLANTQEVIMIKASKDTQGGYNIPETIVSGCTNIKKIATDLVSNLFVLDDNTLKQYSPISQTISDITLEQKISSFAFDYFDNSFYLLSQDDEFLSITKDIQTATLEDLIIPSDFNLTNNGTLYAPSQLKTYKIADGEIAFVVKQVEQKFELDKLATDGEEYLYVCPITDKDNTMTLHILVGKNDIVLTLSNDNCIDLVKNTSVLEKVYVKPSVNALYYPILARDTTYHMTNQDNALKLEKGTELSPLFSVEYLGQTYYYAKFTFDGKEFSGYIPIEFTVNTLDQGLDYNNYSIETISKTNFYYDSDLTQLVFEDKLQDGTAVRLIEKNKNTSKIAVLVDGVWIEGYIQTKYIKDKPSQSIRNILVVLAVVTSLSATSIYFLLKKKKA